MLSVHRTRPQTDPSFLTAPPNFNPTPSGNQTESGHIQLRHLQRQLRQTPLSNQQLDQATRRELETKFLIMVRWNLQKTSPAYQEESAQIILNNWSALSGETQALMTHFCKKHLLDEKARANQSNHHAPQMHPMCPHYKKMLESLLAKVSPCSASSIQSNISEEIAPSHDEIVEINDESTIGTQHPAITMPEQSQLPFKAEYQPGHQIRLFQNKEWRSLKTQIKQAYVSTSWSQFLNGTPPENAQKVIQNNMEKILEQLHNHQKLKIKAQQYIQKKAQRNLYALNETGQGVFRTKGTTLSSLVYRASHQRFYTLPSRMSKEIKTRIKTEQGVDFKGTTFLGEGSCGVVRLANLYENGAHHIVAAKKANTSNNNDIKELENEHNIRTILKGNKETSHWVITNDYFKKISVGHIKSKAILFMDLHAKGSLNTVTHKLSEIPSRALREKAARTVAQQLVNSISRLHQAKIAHRDLKPCNLMLSKEGNLIPIDFGLSSTKETVSDATRGTLAYLAPEELDGQPNRKPKRADLYALGHVLFNVWEAARVGENDPLRQISNHLIHPDPSERPELQAISEELSNDTFTPRQLLYVLHTGKHPNQANAPANIRMA